jgi:hypothetical protein
MATPFTTPIDIQLMIGRLAPGAAFHWKGGIVGLYSDIGQWRTPSIPQPSEADIYAEWDTYLAEQSAQKAIFDELKADYQSAVGVVYTDLTNVQLKAVLAACLYKLGGIDKDDLTIKPLNEWVNQ